MKTYALFDATFFTEKPWWMPSKLYRAVCDRSNPRTEAYMHALLQKTFPDAVVMHTVEPDPNGRLVLLYPDAIGLGWGKREKNALTRFGHVIVLNGRGRAFDLTPQVRRQLRMRRFLEKTFLLEILVTPLLFSGGLLLAIQDKLRGRA